MLPKRVMIREVGPREGFQTHPLAVSIEHKLRLLSLLSATGVKEIEITSLVRADKVPQMADADELIRRYERVSGVRYTALYLNPRGFLRGESTGRLDNSGWLYLAASEEFLRRNANLSVEQAIAQIPEWLQAFSQVGKPVHGVMLSTAFGCSFEGEISRERMMDVLRRCEECLRAHGSTFREVCLADTMGWGSPREVRARVALVRERFPECAVSLHLHDTRGTGMANVYAGLEEGVELFDTSVGGLGGCPFASGAAGNVPTEDVVFLCEQLGIETGISLERYGEAAHFLAGVIGAPLPGKWYKTWHKSQAACPAERD